MTIKFVIELKVNESRFTRGQQMSKWISLILISTFSLLSISCEEKDDNKLAAAQECLDKLNDSSGAASALACEEKISGLTSPQSYVVRCAVRFIVGGVTSSDIVSAFSSYDSAPENQKAAILMAALAQDTPDMAANTVAACKSSKVPSLDYIASISQVGTLMVRNSGNSDPAVFLPNCASAAATCDAATIGTAVTSMYGVYCVGDAAENQTCQEINSAIQAGNGDPTAVAMALYALLQ